MGASNQLTKLELRKAKRREGLELETVQDMKSIINKIMAGIGKIAVKQNCEYEKENIVLKTDDGIQNKLIPAQEQQIGDNTEIQQKELSLTNIQSHRVDPNWIENNDKIIENLQDETKNELKVTGEKKVRKRKPLIRSKRIKRQLYDPYINPGSPPLNRSWALDPRNPWNRNIRYKKHIKLLDNFYLDLYSRTGSDRLPSREQFVKISPPPYFRKGLDSRSLDHYVGEMEKFQKALSKTSDITYGLPSKEIRRRERDKNHTAILKLEEMKWKKKMSRIRLLLRNNNITETERDRLVADIEADKRVMYKKYKTRTTKTIVQKCMEQLDWAAEFVKSQIEVRKKRNVGDESMFEESLEDVRVGNDKMQRRNKQVKIKSKRIKRDIFKRSEILKSELDNLKMNMQDRLRNKKRLERRKREDIYEDNSWYPPYTPRTSSEEERKKKRFQKNWPHLCQGDYGPIWRHNAVYDYPYPDNDETSPTPSTIPKKTTTLSPKEIKRREEMLKMFDEDMEAGRKRGHENELEFLRIKKSANRTKRNAAILNTNKNGLHILGKFRKKRMTLEELMKGPPEDKFEEKKTKLEVDKQAHEVDPDKRKFSMEGTNNEQRKFFKADGEGAQGDFVFDKNVQDSRDDPDHPDNNQVDINAYYEQKALEYIAEKKAIYDESLGIRERMHQDYLKMLKNTTGGFIDRGAINRMELERAHRERAEFLKRQTTESTARIEVTEPTFDALSSFETKEVDEKKPLGKKKLKKLFQELKELRNG